MAVLNLLDVFNDALQDLTGLRVKAGVGGSLDLLGARVQAGIFTDGEVVGFYLQHSNAPNTLVLETMDALGFDVSLQKQFGFDFPASADILRATADFSLFLSRPKDQQFSFNSGLANTANAYFGAGSLGLSAHVPATSDPLSGAGLTIHVGLQAGASFTADSNHALSFRISENRTQKLQRALSETSQNIPDAPFNFNTSNLQVFDLTEDPNISYSDFIIDNELQGSNIDEFLRELENDVEQRKIENDQPNFCFSGDTLISVDFSSGLRIDELEVGQSVLAFSNATGQLEPAHITQIHVTPNQSVIDFHGTLVTPGHVFVQPDDAWREIGAVLLADAFVLNEDGEIIRARTGELVSPETFALLQATIGPSGVPAFEIAAGRMASPSQTAPEDRPQKSLYLPGVTTISGENELNNTNSLLFASSGAGLSTEGGAHGTLTLDPGRQGAGRPFDPWDFSRPAPDGYMLPWAGRETVYNITVEGLHTYIADGWRVHNDSREFRQAGSFLGGLLTDQLFAHFGNDNVALGLAVAA